MTGVGVGEDSGTCVMRICWKGREVYESGSLVGDIIVLEGRVKLEVRDAENSSLIERRRCEVRIEIPTLICVYIQRESYTYRTWGCGVWGKEESTVERRSSALPEGTEVQKLQGSWWDQAACATSV